MNKLKEDMSVLDISEFVIQINTSLTYLQKPVYCFSSFLNYMYIHMGFWNSV